MKKLLKMTLKVIPLVVGALETVSKGLVKRLEGNWKIEEESRLLHRSDQPENLEDS